MIGFSFDKELSYNAAISYIINEYLETKHDVSEINSDDFVYFVKTYYEDLIASNSFENYETLISSFMFSNSLKEMKISNPNVDINNVLSDYLYIFEQFFRLYDEDDDLGLYSQLYNYSRSADESKERHSFLKKKYDLYIAKRNIDDYIKYAYAKYNDADEVAHRLLECAKAKNVDLDFALNYITRDKGYREKFIDITADQIYTVTNNDIYEYVDNILKLDFADDYDAITKAS